VNISGVGTDRSYKIYLKRVGLRLRGLRDGKNWTLEDTEEHGWTSWQHLQKLESGKKDMNLSTIFRLSKLYRVNPSKIVDDEDS
jgi:transcriptional regulator with XRE-family HTH domain